MAVTLRGSGQVPVQIVQATTSTQVTISGTANYADTTLTATITPTNSSNRILVFVYQPWVNSANFESYGGFRLLRDSTIIFFGAGDNTGPYMVGKSNTGSNYGTFALNILDAPNTTSPVTYKTMARNYNLASFIVNPFGGLDASTAIMTLMEIAYA